MRRRLAAPGGIDLTDTEVMHPLVERAMDNDANAHR